MAEEWEYAHGGGGRGSSRSVKAPVPEVVAYPAPAAGYSRAVNQAAVSELLAEQNRHAVEIDEVDQRNLRAARKSRRRDVDRLEETVWDSARDGIREPEAARPPPQNDDEDRTDSDEYDNHYDVHAGEEYERGRADAAEREWREEQRRIERRKARRRDKRSRGDDRKRRGGRRERGTRVRQVPEHAEYESDDSTRQIHSREGSLESESVTSDGMSVQSISTVGSMRSHRSTRSTRSHRSSREPKGILRGKRDRDDRWERGSSHSHRSHRSHRSKAGSSRRGGSRSRSLQHDERALREDVRREVRARAREQDVERRRGGKWDDENVRDHSRSGRSSKSKRKDRERDRGSDRRGSRAGQSRAKSTRGRSSSTSTTPAAWGDHKTATMVHFELPCSCRVGVFYVIGLLVMIGLLVVGVVMIARALLEAEDGMVVPGE